MIIKKEDGKTKFSFKFVTTYGQDIEAAILEKAKKMRPLDSKSFNIIDFDVEQETVVGQVIGEADVQYFSLKREGKHRI